MSMKFAILLAFAVASNMAFEMDCRFDDYDWKDSGKKYTCYGTIDDDIVATLDYLSKANGTHKKGQKNTNVEAIQINGQKCSYMPLGLVKFFPKMTQLFVFRSDLEIIYRSDFTGYVQLRTLSLARNRLSFIPSNAFHDLVNLEYLSLTFNQLRSVPNLQRNRKLKGLYLFENSIQSITADDFSGNGNLEGIWIYHNKLQRIDHRIFDSLKKLTMADFSQNRCIDAKFPETNRTAIRAMIRKDCL